MERNRVSVAIKVTRNARISRRPYAALGTSFDDADPHHVWFPLNAHGPITIQLTINTE